jgi:transcriptional regulator with XRE-family HTH domain
VDVTDRRGGDAGTAASPAAGDPEDDRRHARALGERLRHVRLQQHRSLQEVEQLSGGQLRASVVGAYERGERAVSIRRLEQLATFYRVPVLELLPPTRVARTEGGEVGRVVIDLAALEQHRSEEPTLVRYVDAIRARRGDFGTVLTVRTADLETLAALSDTTPADLRARLVEAGIVR